MNLIAAPLIRKLENFSSITEEERSALHAAACELRHCAAHEDLVQQGEATGGVNLILEGFACRYKILPDGRRQIIAYFIPGDMCDLRVFILKRMDHSIGTLTPCKVAILPRETVLDLTSHYPGLTRALWWATLVDEAVTREWVVNVGQRTAIERMAHLFCELFVRQQVVGLTRGSQCELPLTQTELADTLALSAVHVNRTLKALRREGLVSVRGRVLVIHDLQALETLGMFNRDYLHLDRLPAPALDRVPSGPLDRDASRG